MAGACSTSSNGSGGDEDWVFVKVKKLECPVCYDPLVPPIHQCSNGHLFCKNCEPKVTKCPVCREELPKKIRNRALELIMEELTYNCKNKGLGCTVLLKPSELENHFDFDCPFTQHAYCKLLNLKCEHLGSALKILEHLKSVHDVTGQDLTPSEGETKDWVVVQQTLLRSYLEPNVEVKFEPHYFSLKGKDFILTTEFCKEDAQVFWTVSILTKKAERYCAKIVLESSSNQRCLTWQGEIPELKTKTRAGSSNDKLNSFIMSVPLLKPYASVAEGIAMSWGLKLSIFEDHRHAQGSQKKVNVRSTLRTRAIQSDCPYSSSEEIPGDPSPYVTSWEMPADVSGSAYASSEEIPRESSAEASPRENPRDYNPYASPREIPRESSAEALPREDPRDYNPYASPREIPLESSPYGLSRERDSYSYASPREISQDSIAIVGAGHGHGFQLRSVIMREPPVPLFYAPRFRGVPVIPIEPSVRLDYDYRSPLAPIRFQ